MSRYTGPKLRQARRFGEEFAMASDRSMAAKYVKNNHKQPPGQHGATKMFKKHTSFGLQLLEKQKARVFYHIGEKQMRLCYEEATRKQGSASDNLLQILESRIDNVIYRAGLADSHPQARQFISHRQFALNGKRVSIPSISVKPGDKIEFVGKPKLKDIVANYAEGNKPVSWLKVDAKTLTVEVATLPTREEIEVPFNEQFIIEFYSR
ncbi:MAG: 30S ribosomal protein S4 [Patescibacteria group bacterium]|nr:30S ribosomal protein S4 [Patescibacteria group bacterium]